MKSNCCLLFLVAGLVLAGCGKDESTSTTTTTVTPPPPAPAAPPAGNGYVGAMVRARQLAVKTVDVTSLNEQIQIFNAQEGRMPRDLDELVTKEYVSQLPPAPAGMKLVYDAVTGKVSTTPK